MYIAKLSFLTDREKEIYRLVRELGSQKEAAKRLGIVDSAVTSAMKSLRLKTLKIMNSLEECLELGLIDKEDVLKVLEKSEG